GSPVRTTDEPERTSHSQDEWSPRDTLAPPSFPSSHFPLVCPLALRLHAAGVAVPCQAARPEVLRVEVHPSSVCRLTRLPPVAAGVAVPCQAACPEVRRVEFRPWPSFVCRLARLLPVAAEVAGPCQAACPEVRRVEFRPWHCFVCRLLA